MLLVISPAKALDFETPPITEVFTQPDFLPRAAMLIKQLRTLSPQQLSQLMNISDALAHLNVARYASWKRPFKPANAKQAVLAFNGDVYDGLDAAHLNPRQLEYAQQHLRILSGLYGVLRPLDLIQPYRLEMGTRLANAKGKDLYAFWGDTITQALNRVLQENQDTVLVNLASEEYFKAVRSKLLNARIITPVFQELKNGQYKIISFMAKRARGLMVRYAIEHQLKQPEALKKFAVDGYQFMPADSNATHWMFRRG